jgi:Na+-driven multidrug efflux pump
MGTNTIKGIFISTVYMIIAFVPVLFFKQILIGINIEEKIAQYTQDYMFYIFPSYIFYIIQMSITATLNSK